MDNNFQTKHLILSKNIMPVKAKNRYICYR